MGRCIISDEDKGRCINYDGDKGRCINSSMDKGRCIKSVCVGGGGGTWVDALIMGRTRVSVLIPGGWEQG